ncbi:hypothetical protein [Vibrio jasicida]|uniref:hypothetical protein n=1 Tax=Vibrio jasicida TaxID=766224 RepID=UPI0005EF5774|nr:hypothetical protein [Vibrio jasicida]
MTTLVYDHNNHVIAYESRQIKDERIIITDSIEKLIVIDKHRFLGCGKVADINLLIKAFLNKEPPDCDDLHAILWLIEDKHVRRIGFCDGMLWVNTLDYSTAEGSGSEWAIAALDFGKSAKEAVEYAMTRDPFSGGKVRIIEL